VNVPDTGFRKKTDGNFPKIMACAFADRAEIEN